MIDVELSNIWGSVSLPDLLSGEKDLFDAHMQLRTNMLDGPDFLGWLNAPEGVMARAVLSIGKAVPKCLRTAVQRARGAGLLPAPDRADCCRYGVRRCLPRCPLAA